jgi:hypothetical protein
VKDTPLSCQVVDDELVIRIGIDVLAFAAQSRQPFNIWDDEAIKWIQKIEVVDNLEWAKDIRNELSREEEDGSSPLTNLFESAFEKAVDQGSIAVWGPDYE